MQSIKSSSRRIGILLPRQREVYGAFIKMRGFLLQPHFPNTRCPSPFMLTAGADPPPSGLKRWHLRASKTDGNPPANPGSFQPIITAVASSAAPEGPPASASLLTFALSERKTTLPSSLLAFQRFSPEKSSGTSACWGGGSARPNSLSSQPDQTDSS